MHPALHVLQEYKNSRTPLARREPCAFDVDHNVNTEGDSDGWTYLSDLDIGHANWIYGNNYAAIEPERFAAILSSLPIEFDAFTFIDFGSGKGRALLLASEWPFKKIIGIEFSKELHLNALENFAAYRGATQRCNLLTSICVDFVDFYCPPDPLVLFFFDPCHERILKKVLINLEKSLKAAPRRVYLVYVAPSEAKFALLNSQAYLAPAGSNSNYDYCVFKTTEFG